MQEMMVGLGDSRQGGEKWPDSGSILKIKPTGFPDCYTWRVRERKESRVIPSVLA